jgi:DNA-binding MarR family transcriptional regulator
MRGSRFATPADSPGFLLWQATRRWQRLVTAALRPTGLTHVQFVLLAVLVHGTGEDDPAALSQAELARRAATDPMMTSQVVRALAARGLLERRADPADARVRRLAPTGQGRQAVAEAIGLVERADAELFAGVDADDALALLGALAREPAEAVAGG